MREGRRYKKDLAVKKMYMKIVEFLGRMIITCLIVIKKKQCGMFKKDSEKLLNNKIRTKICRLSSILSQILRNYHLTHLISTMSKSKTEITTV